MNNNDDLPSFEKLFGNNSTWVLLAIATVVVFLFQTIRFKEMSGEEIGVLLNKITGKTEVIKHAGMQIFNGLTHKFYIFDKTIQTLEMNADVNRGDRQEKDDIKIKTIDGSDVFIDVTIQYKIDPNKIHTIVETSGPGNAYKKKWVRDYVRTLVRDFLGELTTEEIYLSEKRTKKIKEAEAEAKKKLEKFGIILDKIAPQNKPRFYREYEAMINQKKLADQEQDEERSKAQEAKQRQHTLIVEETNKKNVAVEQFKGKMEQKLISAKAEGEKVKKAADAYFDKRTINAEAGLYEMKKQAEAILAVKSAEARGIEALKKALEGDGGRNMVKMEYAKKLKDVTITGQPFILNGETERFQHMTLGAASVNKLKEIK